MRFYSHVTEYTVLTRFDGDRRLLARDGAGNKRLLVVITDASEAKRLLPLLLDWQENQSFTEFVECFPNGEGLVAVFAYYADGLPLDRTMEGAFYPHRAVVLRSLFTLILSQDLPPEMLNEVLRPENLLVTRAGEVRLRYDLPRGGTATLRDAVTQITGTAPESPWVEQITDGTLRHYAEMYAVADEAAAALENYIPPQAPEYLTADKLRERVMEIKESLTARWMFILAAVALLTGYAVVGLLFYNTVIHPPGVDNGIRSIGTVVVSDGF